MFGTLCFKETKKRFKKCIRIEEKNIGEVDFLQVTCFKKLNSKKIEKKLKKRIDTIILSDNISGIQFERIAVYNNTDFLKTIATYTFKNIIRLSGIPSNKLSVCLIDKKGEFTSFAYSLANCASVVKITTDNDEKYNEIAENIYDDFGMNPIISKEISSADLGLDLSENIPKIWFNCPENFAEINKSCVKLGAGLRSYVPKGINQCDFAGVLQNYKDFKRLKLLNADVMIKNKKIYKINKENIKNFLDNNDIYC